MMKRTAFGAAAVLAAGLVVQAHAADRVVRLTRPPDLLKGVGAMPSIAEPRDEAERRIDASLSRLDAIVRRAAARCRADGGKDGSWERTVTVPMRGPRYVSYEIVDDVFCGGAHPDVSTMSIVYDLATGAPVDWTALLPASLTGKVSLSPGADGTRMVTLSGRRLYALYLTGYRPRTGDRTDADDEQCRDAVTTAGDGGDVPGMTVWLDARQGGLVVRFDLAHAIQACADSVTIPAAALRAEGAQPVLVDAIARAHGTPPETP